MPSIDGMAVSSAAKFLYSGLPGPVPPPGHQGLNVGKVNRRGAAANRKEQSIHRGGARLQLPEQRGPRGIAYVGTIADDQRIIERDIGVCCVDVHGPCNNRGETGGLEIVDHGLPATIQILPTIHRGSDAHEDSLVG